MKLPLVLKVECSDGPVSLRAVVLKRVLHNLRAKALNNLNREVLAERIDYMNVIGERSHRLKRRGNRQFGVICQDNDRRLQKGSLYGSEFGPERWSRSFRIMIRPAKTKVLSEAKAASIDHGEKFAPTF